MSCVIALGSQLVIRQPVAMVMSEIALGEPHYVCVAQSAGALQSAVTDTSTNGQCAPSPRHQSQQVGSRSIGPGCMEQTSRSQLVLASLPRGQGGDRVLLGFSCYGALAL